MRVKAIKLGYHGLTRRREGEVFDIASEKEFSGKWMEKVEEPKPAKTEKKDDKK